RRSAQPGRARTAYGVVTRTAEAWLRRRGARSTRRDMEGVDVGRSVEEHRDAVRAAVQETARGARPTQVRPLTPDRSGRLARAVHARRPIPGFDDSQMDGFAVRADDLAEARADRPVRLRTTEHVVAGLRNPSPLAPGTAAPIMTGAPLPPGATAVVPI